MVLKYTPKGAESKIKHPSAATVISRISLHHAAPDVPEFLKTTRERSPRANATDRGKLHLTLRSGPLERPTRFVADASRRGVAELRRAGQKDFMGNRCLSVLSGTCSPCNLHLIFILTSQGQHLRPWT